MPRVLSSNTRNTHIFSVQGGEVKKMGFASQAQGGVVGLHRPSACGRSSGEMGKARSPSSAKRLLQGGAVCFVSQAQGSVVVASPATRLWEIAGRDGRGKTFFVSRSLHHQVRKEGCD